MTEHEIHAAVDKIVDDHMDRLFAALVKDKAIVKGRKSMLDGKVLHVYAALKNHHEAILKLVRDVRAA